MGTVPAMDTTGRARRVWRRHFDGRRWAFDLAGLATLAAAAALWLTVGPFAALALVVFALTVPGAVMLAQLEKSVTVGVVAFVFFLAIAAVIWATPWIAGTR